MNKPSENIEKDLETSVADGIATVLRNLPFPGASQATELLNVFSPTMEKRQNQWIIYLHEGFAE